MTRIAFEGGWELNLPDTFVASDRAGGITATDGRKTVHLSSLTIEPPIGGSKGPPANDIHQKRRPESPTYELAGPEDWGWAQLVSDPSGRHLQGTREADATLLTCWISFPDEADRDWAVDA